MTVAISIAGLSKRYHVPHDRRHAKYRTLRESVSDLAKAPIRRLLNPSEAKAEEFWALKDVNFEVESGEVVGIIGLNGAGKSTLLKILSRITKPTTGQVKMHGRVGSLLEVGTGFHPELTGRENIFLNGSILGMSRSEIRRQFDRIVDFAGTEQFLDIPVKRYSSGMYVRLAFSVAAHLEPEILFVDEVLSVGDASFQRKCIDRMAELARSGTTLLFVSHNLDIIPRLCRTAIHLERGQVKEIGPSETVIDGYISSLVNDTTNHSLSDRHHSGNGMATFQSLSLLDGDNNPTAVIATNQNLRCVLEISAKNERKDVSLGLVIKSLHESRYITSWTEEVGFKIDLSSGVQRYECLFKNVRLRPGRQVAIELWMFDGDVLDHIGLARVVDVVETVPCGFSSRSDQGAFLCDYEWTKV